MSFLTSQISKLLHFLGPFSPAGPLWSGFLSAILLAVIMFWLIWLIHFI